jgi:aspartate aminotransferase
MMFADRTRRVQLSPTFRVAALARELRAKGVDVLDFSVGEPDFPTPAVVKEAGKDAIDRDITKYTANEGTIELRRAIAEKLRTDNGLEYAPEEIVVSPGAKASLFCAAMALFQDGDEVIVPSPYWVSHPEQVRLAGATPVFVEAREANGFRLTAAEIERSVGTATRAVLLNYPSNPTGACWDAGELAEIARLCVARDLLVVADEIYEKLLYDGRTFTSIATCPGMRERTIVVNGMSKAFAMTGWRVGWAAAPKAIAAEISKVQSHSTGHPPSMAQFASVEAFRAAGDTVVAMAREFEARRGLIVKRLREIPGVACVVPDGAFYAFPNVSGLFGKTVGGRVVRSGEDVALALLDEARVAVVPGEAFGSASHVRISFSCSRERIEQGMDRIAGALA